jgi:ribosomal protein S7
VSLESYLIRDLNSDESTVFQDWLLDDYATTPNTEDFEYLKYSSFNLFFSSSGVDRPRCLLSYWSSRREINKHLLLKTSNYLMRKGKRQQSLGLLLDAVRESYTKHIRLTPLSDNSLDWKSIFSVVSRSYYLSNYNQFPHTVKHLNQYNYSYNYIGKEHSNFLDMRNVVLTNINKVNPMFSFYIYKVDKAIYKNSRGKSGKFTFIWKYLPPYKRRQLVLSWIMKEVKMQQGKTFDARVAAVISTLYESPSSLFINKVQKFSINYVYWNSRKSLCETYRTVTK